MKIRIIIPSVWGRLVDGSGINYFFISSTAFLRFPLTSNRSLWTQSITILAFVKKSGTSSANSTIGFFSGSGYHDYYTAGNSISNNATLTANTSPAGDILISTKGFVSGDNYTIILEVR